ncbi:MAG: hypothetical protein K0U23_00265 [Gammaproteobacteria bacterium]|nr:hypothetical protein [Gammaproteobacteria bacterium]
MPGELSESRRERVRVPAVADASNGGDEQALLAERIKDYVGCELTADMWVFLEGCDISIDNILGTPLDYLHQLLAAYGASKETAEDVQGSCASAQNLLWAILKERPSIYQVGCLSHYLIIAEDCVSKKRKDVLRQCLDSVENHSEAHLVERPVQEWADALQEFDTFFTKHHGQEKSCMSEMFAALEEEYEDAAITLTMLVLTMIEFKDRIKRPTAAAEGPPPEQEKIAKHGCKTAQLLLYELLNKCPQSWLKLDDKALHEQVALYFAMDDLTLEEILVNLDVVVRASDYNRYAEGEAVICETMIEDFLPILYPENEDPFVRAAIATAFSQYVRKHLSDTALPDAVIQFVLQPEHALELQEASIDCIIDALVEAGDDATFKTKLCAFATDQSADLLMLDEGTLRVMCMTVRSDQQPLSGAASAGPAANEGGLSDLQSLRDALSGSLPPVTSANEGGLSDLQSLRDTLPGSLPPVTSARVTGAAAGGYDPLVDSPPPNFVPRGLGAQPPGDAIRLVALIEGGGGVTSPAGLFGGGGLPDHVLGDDDFDLDPDSDPDSDRLGQAGPGPCGA